MSDFRSLSRLGICSLATVSSIILALYTLATTHIPYVTANEYGLMSKLPISFWLGLALLLFLLYVGRDSEFFMVVTFVLTVFYLYCIPTMAEEYPRCPWSYYPSIEGKLIASTGRFTPEKSVIANYHDWPLFLLLSAILTLIPSLPLLILYKYFPILIVFVYGVIIFLLLKTKLTTQDSLRGAIWFLGSFWLDQQYFGAQSIAFVFLLLIYLTILRLLLTKDMGNRMLMVLLIFFFLATMYTNPLTPVALLSGATTLFFFNSKERRRIMTYRIYLLLILIFFAYNLLEAYPFFQYAVSEVSEKISDIPVLYAQHLRRVEIIGSPQQVFANTCKLAIVGLNILTFSLASLFLMRGSLPKNETFWVCWPLGITLLAVFNPYGGEMLFRIFMFGLPFTSYLHIRFWQRRKFFYITFIVLILLHVPAHYGNECVEMVTKADLVGSAFYTLHTNETSPYFLNAGSTKLLWHFSPDLVRSQHFSVEAPLSENITLHINSAIEKSKYTIISWIGQNYLLYYYGKDYFEHIDSEWRFDRIYDSAYYRIYLT